MGIEFLWLSKFTHYYVDEVRIYDLSCIFLPSFYLPSFQYDPYNLCKKGWQTNILVVFFFRHFISHHFSTIHTICVRKGDKPISGQLGQIVEYKVIG